MATDANEMTSEVTKKRKIRAGHRSSTKRTINASHAILDDFNPSDKSLTEKLMQQKITLKEKLNILQALDDDILGNIEETDIEKEIEDCDLLREHIHATVVRIDSAVNSANVLPDPEERLETGHNLNSSIASQAVAKVKLPKLSLKKFKGDIKEWTPFWDSYSSAIHNNPDLNSIDKFNYLNSLLESSAAEAISGLKLTSANYEEAIEVLERRFGNKQHIINTHMESLLQLPAVTSLHDLHNVRRLYDKVESHVRGLKSLGVATESYGNLMISILMQKLPPGLRITATKKMEKGEWSLDALLTLFRQELEARERANLQGLHAPKQPNHQRNRIPPSASSLLSSYQDTTCTYCQEKHLSANCKTVTNITARRDILKRSGRCFICLRKNHISRDCQSNNKCFKCGKRHHASLCASHQPPQNPPRHSPRLPPQAPKENEKLSVQSTRSDSKDLPREPEGLAQDRNQQEQPAIVSHTTYIDTRTSILLQTAKANIYKQGIPEEKVKIRLILDSGSQRSYVTTKLKDRLNLNPEGTETLLIKTFGGEDEQPKTCDIVNLTIETESAYPDLSLTAFVVPTICQPLTQQSTQAAQEQYHHLDGLHLADVNTSDEELEVDLLVGSDQFWNLVTGAVRRGDSGPNAMNTKVGWVLSGPVNNTPSKSSVNLVNTHVLKCATQLVSSEHQNLTQELRRFWELESLGIHPSDESVYERFTQSINLKNNRYEVELPWRETHPILPDNHRLSERRLKSLLTRLRKDPQILQEYDNVIQDQLRNGVVEVVDDSCTGEVGKVHYLPHHAVIRRDKSTTKMRIVYDASAKENGPSLNDCLYTGPALAQNILDILLRFRCHRVALVGDIEKAFLMLSIQDQDRDVLRFLWVDDIHHPKPKIITLRFTRVVFGVSSSPFLLNATIKNHMEQHRINDPEFVEQFLQAIYVDDLNAGGDNEDAAFLFYKKAKLRLAGGGFNLRKFCSNSSSLMARIQENETLLTTNLNGPQATCLTHDESSREDKTAPSQSEKMELDESYTKNTTGNVLEPTTKQEQKILGVKWNYAEDCFVFDLEPIVQAAKNCEPTKRNIISVASKFYDPLGYISPIIIQMKLLFQSLCDNRMDWDTPLTGELRKKWLKLIDDLEKAKPITLPRCYFGCAEEKIVSRQLHGFCDASIAAYAAVIYLVVTTTTRRYTVFVTAKTRVAPIQKQTIPRLELLSAVILARLMKTVHGALEPVLKLDENVVCWTDSLATLYWIRGETKEWKQFVQLRANEIRSLVPLTSWRHCPGEHNPADIPTRSVKAAEFGRCKLWHRGPSWLTEDAQPDNECLEESDSAPEECLTEMKAKKMQCNSLTTLCTEGTEQNLKKVIIAKNFSSYHRLLRVTAYVLRFVQRMKSNTEIGNNQSRKQLNVPQLTEEIEEAETLWLREMQALLPGYSKYNEWKRQFGTFTDENGIIRCGGRLENASIPASAKHPVLLDPRQHLTLLIVRHCHERVKHSGVKGTLTELRSRFWIVRGRQFIKDFISKCPTCKRYEGKPYQAPPPPPLPECRVKEEFPFASTGLDFAGPLYVRNPERKVWISLYTCCVTRAMHLDLVPDMSAEAFLRNFRRFCSRRGVPSLVISDNAKTFKSASRKLSSLFDCPRVKNHFTSSRIKWSFILEKAPWWGGFYERMVKSVKRCLRKTLGNARLSYEELLTELVEVESVLNSRPLTYSSSEDLEEPVTPSHLLYGRRLLSLPEPDDREREDGDWEPSSNAIAKRQRHLAVLLNHFWRRWRTEYLLELRESHRDRNSETTNQEPVKIGDIVIVHDEGRSRGLWRVGRIECLIQGKDSQVRGAKVRVAETGKRPTTLRRPLQKLYPLEIGGVHIQARNQEDDTEQETDAPQVENELKSTRCKRAAAVEASRKRRELIMNGQL